MKRIILFISCLIVSGLVGCSSAPKYNKDGVMLLNASRITNNRTPYTTGLECTANRLTEKSGSFSRKLRIAVGDMPDLTGKVNATEGAKITQGVEYMAITALNKLSDSIDIVERTNLDVYNIEADLMGKRLIGDGRKYNLSNGKKINYRPLLSGSITGADYFITGAVTEINYNLYSGGNLVGVSGLEFGKRTVVMNVAMDMRIVKVHNLQVVDAISLQKQFIGERTKQGTYRFFDSELVSFDGGSSRDEPIQRGVRSLIEKGISTLIGKVMRVPTETCFQDK